MNENLEELPMKKHTVLFIDDDEMILNAIKRALRNENYHILTATSGDRGLMLLKDHPVGLVICDYQMPGKSGLEVLKDVKRTYPRILTIMLTGQAEVKIAAQAINDCGVYKFILKPWEDADLKITIRRALESLDLIQERDHLLRKVQDRDMVLQNLEKKHPGISNVKRDEDGYIIG